MQVSPEFPWTQLSDWDKEECDSYDELSLDYNFSFQERESVQERPEFPWTQLLDWERDNPEYDSDDSELSFQEQERESVKPQDENDVKNNSAINN